MPVPEPPATLRAQQLELTRHLRDPQSSTAPDGIEERRLAIYRDLLFNNIEGLLAGNFPVIRALLGDTRWRLLVRAFYREHRSQTPLFTEIAREFLAFVEARAAAGPTEYGPAESGPACIDPACVDPPFLAELAHYEWVELALQISEATTRDIRYDPDGDLLDGVAVVSPLAWPLAYRWPVHRLGPDCQPGTPPDIPTFLLLRREPDGNVRFSNLTPLAFRLLQRLGEAPDSARRTGRQASGREHLQALAQESGTHDPAAFIEQGHALLQQMHATGVLLGTIRAE